MRCPNCDYENPEGRRYCEECGERLIDLETLKARARRRSGREAAVYRREAQKEGLDAVEAERRLRRSRRRAKPWMGLLLLLILVVIIVIIVVVAAGGGESGPEKAVKEFYGAIRNKDAMTFLKHTEPDVYKMAQRGEYQPDPVVDGIDYDTYILDGLTTRLVKEEGDLAEVEVIAGYFEGINNDASSTTGIDFAQYPRLVRLVKVEGAWIVQDYQLMKLPYPIADIMPEQPEYPEVEEQAGESS